MAQDAAQQAIQNTEQLADAQTLAESLAQDGNTLLPEQVLAGAMDQLLRATRTSHG